MFYSTVYFSRYKDAVVLSPHKFIGGPGTPGKFIKPKYCEVIFALKLDECLVKSLYVSEYFATAIKS